MQGIHYWKKGRRQLDAVRAAMISLEDNILFNAGKGSVFAKDGSQEMDASIMDGRILNGRCCQRCKKYSQPH